jgi:hypothetical protein
MDKSVSEYLALVANNKIIEQKITLSNNLKILTISAEEHIIPLTLELRNYILNDDENSKDNLIKET